MRIVQRADIQKVTLQVHVAVTAPDDLLRPEMLCQVRFFGKADATGAGAGGKSLLIPARLLVGGNSAWVLDVTTNTARLRKITVGDRNGDWVEVRSGLNVSDKLIDGGRAGLQDGVLVSVEEGR